MFYSSLQVYTKLETNTYQYLVRFRSDLFYFALRISLFMHVFDNIRIKIYSFSTNPCLHRWPSEADMCRRSNKK